MRNISLFLIVFLSFDKSKIKGIKKTSYLESAEADGEIYTCPYQQNDEGKTPNIVPDLS
jgi:hypothetical protein